VTGKATDVVSMKKGREGRGGEEEKKKEHNKNNQTRGASTVNWVKKGKIFV
jgi:hypothetical protein